jgi:hypothetical protein
LVHLLFSNRVCDHITSNLQQLYPIVDIWTQKLA